MARRRPSTWLRDEVLRPVTAVVTRVDGVEYWAIKPAGSLARFRPRVRLTRDAARAELRRRMPRGPTLSAYPAGDDGPLSVAGFSRQAARYNS